MRRVAVVVVSIVVALLLCPAHAGAADPRVKRALDAQELNYEIDEDGDFQVIIAWSEEERSQVVVINSNTQVFGDVEIREVWSPGYRKETDALPSRVANKLLEANATYKIGAWEVVWSGEIVMAVLNAKISADCSPEHLVKVLGSIAETADSMERELLASDDL